MRFQKGRLIALSSRKVENFIGIIGHGIPSSDVVFQRERTFQQTANWGQQFRFCSTYYLLRTNYSKDVIIHKGHTQNLRFMVYPGYQFFFPIACHAVIMS